MPQSPKSPASSAASKQKRNKSLNPLEHEHIPPSVLPNVKNYKYSGVDHSIMSKYIMNYYWSAVVELLPMWVAPNLVTLVGFIVSISATLLLLFFRELDTFVFDGGLGSGSVAPGEYPAYVWYYAAFSLFAYQTLDAIDGKQARRTKSGSPMGELFDHGCDAFFTPLLQVNLCLALNLDPVQRFFVCVTVTSGLLFAIWEQYVTGTLDFGYITGPTEGILVTCCIFIVTGLRGTQVWWEPLQHVLDTAEWISPDRVFGARIRIDTLGTGLVWFVFLSATLTVLGNVAHVLTRKSVHASRWVAVECLLPNAVILLMFVVLRREFPEVFEQAPFVPELCYGFLASYTATRLTVARLCAMRYRPWSFFYLLTVLILGVAITVRMLGLDTNVTSDVVSMCLIASLRVLMGVGIVQYLHLIVSVFRQISHVLDIEIFRVKKTN